MGWPTRTDLNIDEKRLVELTDSDEAPGAVDEPLLERLRLRAIGIVEGHCTDYVTPIADAPTLVADWCLMIWRYLIYSHRPEMTMPETVRLDYSDARKQLQAVLEQKLPLSIPAKPSSLPPSQTGGGVIEDVERLFGRGRDGLA